MNKMSKDSATQLNQILSFLPEDEKRKIPQNIWNEINNKTDNSINTKIYNIEDITNENVLSETRRYLSFIFLNFLATDEEKEEYIKIIKNNEKRYQKCLSEKYSVDNMFIKRQNRTDINQEYEEEKKENLPIVHKEKFFIFILNKIKSLFKKDYR